MHALLVPLVFALGVGAAPFWEAGPRSVTLAVCDVQSLPLDTAALRGEVAQALAGSGVVIRWRVVAPGEGAEATAGRELLVTLLATRPGARWKQRVLGMVLRDSPEPSPIWVFVNDVRALLAGRERGGLPDAAERRRLSVALGRVIAHEVVHALAPAHPHAVGGLMAGAVKRDVLAEHGAGLDRACLEAVRFALISGRTVPRLGPLTDPHGASVPRPVPGSGLLLD